MQTKTVNHYGESKVLCGTLNDGDSVTATIKGVTCEDCLHDLHYCGCGCED